MNLRRAVRALVVDTSERLVLVRFDFPDRIVWAAPGGGLEDGEDYPAALARELREELGLGLAPPLADPVWVRTHVFPMSRWDGQTERYYVVRVPSSFTVRPTLSWDELRSEGVGEIRWWTLDEIRRATEVTFAPARLGHFLEQLLRDGPPAAPIDVGV